jgi:hypothetical protein
MRIDGLFRTPNMQVALANSRLRVDNEMSFATNMNNSHYFEQLENVPVD